MSALKKVLRGSSQLSSRVWGHLLSVLLLLLACLMIEVRGADFLLPDAPSLKPHLQYWWKADSLTLADGAPVQLWPDQSGHGRDLSPTKGVRVDGVGVAPVFAAQSTINKRPAIRFTPESGLAASPDNQPAITGDPALTITLVICLQPHEVGPPHDGVVGLGNPANPNRDPGRPLAALVQINRGEDHALHFAGGWNHDASLGKGSFKPHYGQPLLLTITKTPGSMKKTTTFFLNGEKAAQKIEGRDTKPDIQYRTDIGAYLGKAVNWAGSIRGDVSEIVVYNKALSDEERRALESHLSDKYAILLKSQVAASRAKFKPEQRNWWAFQPVKKAALPAVKNETWVHSDIDRFILEKQEASGLGPAPAADKRTLLRRATFDLTGLPPMPDEIDAFVKDESPDAFKKVVERLLASPHYGERWGRHWLDVVRYAETTANDANAVMRYAWRYRDYVVDAFNRDLPYDQFIIEQLAGDLLPPIADIGAQARRVIATGFLLLGPKALAETDKEQSKIDIVDDQLDTMGRAFLGLTIGCARCHDHKFDPIPTTDYYALAGIFRSTEVFMDEARNSSMWWQFPLFEIPGEKPFIVMAPKEALPRNLRVHKRGDRMRLGEVAPRGVLQVLSNGALPIRTTQSGRLELARWIAGRDNPLTARVMANRIWQHHFGTGLVATSDNFGTRGELPSHPQLLDSLAASLMDNGWSMKSLHRLIMNSAVYQQATAKPAADPRLLAGFARRKLTAEEIRDAILATSGQLDRAIGGSESGEVLWQNAEQQDVKRGFGPNQMKGDHPHYTTCLRRSLYLPVVRNMMPDVLALFDAADPNSVTAVRNDTTVPSQSLFLLNHPFALAQARAFANRLLTDSKATDDDRLKSAYRLALGREPSVGELAEGRDYVGAYSAATAAQARPEAERRVTAWQSYCQTLFSVNEFLYVE